MTMLQGCDLTNTDRVRLICVHETVSTGARALMSNVPLVRYM